MGGRTIAGRYHLEQPLGGGAMGSVWLAHDATLEREVAVKLLAPDADRARFDREARAVAALAHPNICRLYDYGETENGPYMVLEYLPGGTLEDRLRTPRPLPDAETAAIAQQLAAGLAHAHSRGLVHRDLKPSNVLFDGEGRAKIADFGIARMEGGRSLTVAGTVLGTAATIAPEQAAGLPATPASDVYSFGVILFRLLTGQPPFGSSSAVELVRMHQEQEAPRVASVRPDAPPALASVADAALAKDPAQRPRDGEALVATLGGDAGDETLVTETALTRVLARGSGAAATHVLPPPRVEEPAGRRSRVPIVVAAVAVAVLVAGVALAVVATNDDDPSAPATTSSHSSSNDAPLSSAATSTDAPVSTEAPPETTAEEATTAPATTAAPTTAEQTTTALPATTAPPPPTTSAPLTTAPTATTAPTLTVPTESLPPTTLPVPTESIIPPVTS